MNVYPNREEWIIALKECADRVQSFINSSKIRILLGKRWPKALSEELDDVLSGEPRAPISVPPSGGMSALDGITLVAIDTDPETHLEAMKVSAPIGGLSIISVTPFSFHGTTPGYIVVTYDPTKDPRSSRYHALP